MPSLAKQVSGQDAGKKCEMEVHTEKSICNFILFFFNDEKKLLRANGIG